MELEKQSTLGAADRSEILRMLQGGSDAADRAISYLIQCFDHSNESGRVYARRHRIKSEADIEEKVKRKITIEGKIDYKWTDITDVVGIRFVTLYRDDIFPVTEIILKALCDLTTEIKPCPFIRENMRELRLFVANTNPLSDAIAIQMKSLAGRVRRPRDRWRYKGPELGDRYSSVHFVTSYSSGQNSPAVPIEIQIRTVFEDAWGEVDHAALYEPRRLGVPIEGSLSQVERCSNAFKKMMDASANFADAIRSISSTEKTPIVNMVPTIEDSNYVKTICRKLNVPREREKRLLSLIAAKEYLDYAIKSREVGVRISDYISFADEFSSFLKAELRSTGFLRGNGKGTDARQLYYILAMEESVCRILSSNQQQTILAIQELGEVTTEFPSHPVAWLRLGEACAKLLEQQQWSASSEALLDLGDRAFGQAHEAVRGLATLPSRERIFAASALQEQYVRDSVGRLHAHLIWRSEKLRSNEDRPTDAMMRACGRALGLTHAATSDVLRPESRARLINGLVYYAAELLDTSRAAGVSPELPCDLVELRNFVAELEHEAQGKCGFEAIQLWDTVAYGTWMIDGEEAASVGASSVLNAHCAMMLDSVSDASEYLREQTAKAVERALRILGILR